MEFRDQLYHHQPPPPPQFLSYPYASSSSSSFSYFPHPNPNPNHISTDGVGNSLHSSAAAAASDALRQSGVDPYLHDPYASQVDYSGAHSLAAQSYANDYYFQQLYAANPFTYEFMKIGTNNTNTDLETKKRKVIEGGARADSVKVCTVCNIVCNSDKVFVSHLAGEKHALKARGILTGGLNLTVPPSHVNSVNLLKKTMPPAPKTAAKRASQGLVGFVQSSYCDVCKLNCNSQEAFNNHRLGKKHLRNLQKLQESFAPKPANAPVRNISQKDQQMVYAIPSTREDLQLKTRKVLNGGAAATAVKVCALCNVVCNSETVFNYHIAGKKHLAMVNQQAAPVIY